MTLPEGRGEFVYSQLKNMILTRHIPILIITADAPKYMEAFLEKKEINREDIFLKPFDSNSLLEKINSHFSEQHNQENH